MFKDNKYTRTYYAIIKKAKNSVRSKEKDYFESHHIIPKCSPFFGDNKKDNIVLLTAKEHFICHMLLTKMCGSEGKHKMIYALNNMTRISKDQKRNITSAQYDYVKRQLSITKTGSKHSEETLSKFKNRIPWNKGKTKETDERIKIAAENMSGDNHHRPMSGRIVSDEVKKKISESQLGNKNTFYGKTHSNLSKNKMSSSHFGKKHNENTKKKMSDAKKIENKGAESVRGSRWINNSEICFLLKSGENIPDGFKYGRIR